MKTYKSRFFKYAALGIFGSLLLTGCNSLNDNPVDSSKMSEIRHKEAADRGNFKPTVTAPPSGGK